MDRGDIYLVSLDPASGREQQGHRPVLVVSADAFTRASGTPMVVPITTGGGFARARGFAVSLEGAGTRTAGVALCHQARVLDLRARGARKVESLPPELVAEVLAKLKAILG